MKTPREPRYDVIVVGGGPSGATVACRVARAGHRVLLLERAREPQFKVGESLMPATYWTFEKLGLLDAMRRSSFPVKGSVQFFSADGRASNPFYFQDHDPHESSLTWQVLRRDFDQMLLDHAAASGAEVRRGVGVREVLFENDQAIGVLARAHGKKRERLGCRVVVDATGQSSLLARELDLVDPDPCLRHAAFFTHFDGASRDTGRDAGATLILHTQDRRSWFWLIPLPDNRASVGVVGPIDYLVRGRSGNPQRIFEDELAKCPALRQRLGSARQVLPMQVLRDFSYRVRALAGNGWVLVGDAGGFIDPIYSTGVFLALKSGELAAESICEALQKGDLSATSLGTFELDFRRGVDAMRKLVYAFYDPHFSFGAFLTAHPDCRGQLVDLLMGNVYRRPVDRLLAALAEFSTAEDVPREVES